MHLHWQSAFNNGNTVIEYVHEHDSEFILFHFLNYEIQYQNARWIVVIFTKEVPIAYFD